MIAFINTIGCLVLSIIAIGIPVALGYCLNELFDEGVTVILFVLTVIEFFGLFFILTYFCEIY